MFRLSAGNLAALVSGVGILTGVQVAPIEAGELPKSLFVAGGAQGSVNYTVSAGLATVVTKHTAMNASVVSFSGPSSIFPALMNGEVQVAVSAETPKSLAQFVKGDELSETNKKLRIVSAGAMNEITLAVLDSSGIKTGNDLRGKRVAAQFSGLPICHLHATALLANHGLTWDDVVPVPVVNSVQASRALAEGRADVGSCSGPALAALREVHARTPVRFLSVDASEAAMARALKVFDYQKKPSAHKKGDYGWLANDANFLAHPWYMYATSDVSDDVAYATAKALWEHNSELGGIHPILRQWTPKSMVFEDATVPYHPGAIKYYREVGAWTAAMDDNQKRLLAR